MLIQRTELVLLAAFLLGIPIFDCSLFVASFDVDPIHREAVMKYINEQQKYMTKPWLTPKKKISDLAALRKHAYQLFKRPNPTDLQPTVIIDYEEASPDTNFDCYQKYGRKNCNLRKDLFYSLLF